MVCRLLSNFSNRLGVFRFLSTATELRSAMSVGDVGVSLEKVGCAGIITLNRPKFLNALNLTMINVMYPKLLEWEQSKDIQMVIIRGSGNKAFCAGGDVKAVCEAGRSGGLLAKDFFREEYKLNYLIGTFRKPYIALVDGIVMGGGVGLSVHGRVRVATEKTTFAMPETAIGLFPDVGGGYFLPRLKGKLGTFLALTGHRLVGLDVMKAGVATHFVKSALLDDLQNALVSLQNPDSAQIFNLLQKFYLDSRVDDHPFVLEPVMQKINSVFSATTTEDVFNRLLAMSKSDEWAGKQLEILKKMSPTSLKVTHHLMQEGVLLNFADTFKVEYRLSQRCMADHDFFEGVRATLIDKDGRPAWKPNRLDLITDEKIAWYFSPLPSSEELLLDHSRLSNV